MTHEQMSHKQSCFLTLTYDDAHLPFYGQLVKSDLQKFFKRLRKNTGPFKYVACGEYGDQSRRPHFHVALYGMDFSGDRKHYGFSKSGDRTYRSAELARSWSFGNADIGCLNFESAAYLARYVLKKIKGPNASSLPLGRIEETGELVMPNPEFLCASNGIGAEWYERFFMTDIFPHASVVTAQGSKAPVPRYYKDRLRRSNLGLSMRMRANGASRMHSSFEAADAAMREDLPHRRSARAQVSSARIRDNRKL